MSRALLAAIALVATCCSRDIPESADPLGGMPDGRVVRPGETLWSIAHEELGSGARWREIADANGIDDPEVLPVGAVLHIQGGAR